MSEENKEVVGGESFTSRFDSVTETAPDAATETAPDAAKTHCQCGQSINYVDRQNGVCPSCGETL